MRDYDPRMSFDSQESVLRHDHRGDENEAVAFLAAQARGGPVLELAVGSGRLAIPLAAQGLAVHGIDFAEPMLQRLREKPGAENVTTTLADFADVDVPGSFPLIFIAWNSLFNLLTQDEQSRCFENVARRLPAGGRFVVEAFVPTFLFAPPVTERVDVEALSAGEVRLGVLKHDPVAQRIDQNHVTLTEQGHRFNPVAQRYAWPAELDLMAKAAGLDLEARFADWQRRPLHADSEQHVSVYVKPS